MPRTRRLVCHDCHAVLTPGERMHYVYQCHRCVVIEHDLVRMSATNPDHPDLDRLAKSAVDLGLLPKLRRPEPGPAGRT